jgi:hypothetical protein
MKLYQLTNVMKHLKIHRYSKLQRRI